MDEGAEPLRRICLHARLPSRSVGSLDQSLAEPVLNVLVGGAGAGVVVEEHREREPRTTAVIDISGQRSDAVHGSRLGVDSPGGVLQPPAQRSVNARLRKRVFQQPPERLPRRPRQQFRELPGRTGVGTAKTGSIRDLQTCPVDSGRAQEFADGSRSKLPTSMRPGLTGSPRPSDAGSFQQAFGKKVLAVLSGAGQNLLDRRAVHRQDSKLRRQGSAAFPNLGKPDLARDVHAVPRQHRAQRLAEQQRRIMEGDRTERPAFRALPGDLVFVGSRRVVEDRRSLSSGPAGVQNGQERGDRVDDDIRGGALSCGRDDDVQAVIVEVQSRHRGGVPLAEVVTLPRRVNSLVVKNGGVEDQIADAGEFPVFANRVRPPFQRRIDRLAPRLVQSFVAEARIAVADDHEVRAVGRQDGFKRELRSKFPQRGRHAEDFHGTRGRHRLIRIDRQNRSTSVREIDDVGRDDGLFVRKSCNDLGKLRLERRAGVGLGDGETQKERQRKSRGSAR